MVLRVSVEHWQLVVVLTLMALRLLLKPPRTRKHKRNALRKRNGQPRRCWGQSRETARTLAGITPRGDGASKVLSEVRTARALNGLYPQEGGGKRQVADASPQVGGDTQRALDGPPQAVVAEPRLAHFLRLLRNRQRNLGCVSTTSRIDVNASQEHRMAIANTSTSIRLDSNLCPSRTRCLLPVPLLLAKRVTSPRFLAGTETDASITKRENASSGMHQVRLRFAYLGPL